SQLRGRDVDILEDVRNRVLVLVAKQFGEALGQPLQPLHQLGRAIEQRAEAAGAGWNDRATLRTRLADRRASPDSPVQLDFADSGEADALDLCGRALKDRRLFIDFDSDPDELGPVGKQRNLGDLAYGNAREGDVRTLVEAADALGEVNIVALRRLVREAGKPNDEQEHADKQRHRHGADHYIVRPGLHQAVTSCS